MRQRIQSKVKARILKRGRGWIFTSSNFSDLGGDSAVRKALSSLQKKKIIRRIAQGIYDYPIIHDLLGEIPPDLKEVAQVIAEKYGTKIQPTGAYAANLIGFSEQVPGKIIFLTEGLSRKVKIGMRQIIFKKTSVRMMYAAGTKEGLLIQALRYWGKQHLDENIKSKSIKLLQNTSSYVIKKNMKFAPAWIRNFVFNIMEIKP